jgi:hypothetical protein
MAEYNLFKNSYVIFILSLLILSGLFYLLGIGFNYETDENGKIVKTFTFYYPLAFALIIWVLVHFFIYPQDEDTIKQEAALSGGDSSYIRTVQGQRINMAHWY